MESTVSEDYYRAVVAKYGSPYLTTLQAAEYLKLQPRTLEKMRWRRRGPTFRRHGRFVRYHIPDLDAYSCSRAGHAAKRTRPTI